MHERANSPVLVLAITAAVALAVFIAGVLWMAFAR
jgi:hypothetical protein